MANSYQSATSDGTMTYLDISIDYLDRSEIVVLFDGVLIVEGTDWDWSGTSDKRITFPVDVPNGINVTVKRITDASELRHEFSTGAAFTASSLDEDLKQSLHIAQEAAEGNVSGEFFQDVNMHGFRLYNVGTAVNDADALTLAQYKADADGAYQAKLDAEAAAATATAATTALRTDLANTADAREGAGLSGFNALLSYNPGTVGGALNALMLNVAAAGVPTNGTDGTAALVAADALAATRGCALVFPAGMYLVSANMVFTAKVVMLPGARLKTSTPSVYLKFSVGFEAGLDYVLDVDGPTQFLRTERILPQWFGATGLNTDDQTVALTRAFRAARAACSAGTSHPDVAYGTRIVHFPSGVYRGNDIPVYCGTIIEGEWQGSLFGSTLTQIDYLKPLLRMMPKNYDLDGTVLNDSVGQNYFRRIGFRSEVAASVTEGLPIVYFMSAAQATTYLAIAGDSAGGNVGHVDTMFSECWFKDGNTSVMCDEGTLWVHVRNCTFDVCRRAVQHKGTARGRINSYNNIYYGMTWGAFDNQTSDVVSGVSWESHADEFKAGNTSNSTAAYRRALNYSPTGTAPGTSVRIHGSHFRRTDGLGTRHGGAIFLNNVEAVDLNVWMIDPDSANDQKAIAIQGGVKFLRLEGQIISNSIDSYTNSRMIQISQSPQTLLTAKIDMELINTNASSYATGLHSNFAVTGVDVGRLLFSGNFTSRIDTQVSGNEEYVPVLASSATMALPAGSRVFSISGTTSITNLTTTGWAGKRVTLVFQGILTVTDGGNLKLATNFVTTADDSITLVCDGTNWFEVTRSVN